MTVTAPAAPALTVTADGEAGTVRLTLTCADNSVSTGSQYVQAQVSTDGGATWTFLRHGDGVPVDTDLVVTLRDDEAPAGTPLLYQARAFQDDGATQAYSAWTTAAAPVTVTYTRWWYCAPQSAAGKLTLPWPFGDITWTRRQPQTVIDALGRTTPVVLNGTRKGRTGTLRLVCRGLATYTDAQALLDTQLTLLVQSPTGEQWYVAAGDVTETWRADASLTTDPYRVLEVKVTEVARP